MAYSRQRSIALNNAASQRIYRTFADWQAEQLLDERTSTQRGLQVGSCVMWRHMHGKLIVTDRATILEMLDGDRLLVRVKDVSEYTCDIHMREVVNRSDDHAPLTYQEMKRRTYLQSQVEIETATQGVVL